MRASEIAPAHRGYLRAGISGPVIRVHGKGDKWRELPAHPEVQRVLRSASGWLFPGRYESPVTAHTMSKQLSALLPGEWTAHSLRHARSRRRRTCGPAICVRCRSGSATRW